MDAVQTRLDPTLLTAEEISQWFAAEKAPDAHKPLGHNKRALFSFSVHGIDGFVGWTGSSAAERSFAVEHQNDDFMCFAEHGTGYDLATGSLRHIIKPGAGLLTSADRYSAIEIGEMSVAEGFCVPRDAILRALVATYDRPPPGSFEFFPACDLTSGPGQSILKLMRFFRDDICGAQGLAASPLALAMFQEAFCLLLVQNFNHTMTDWGSTQRTMLAPRQIRKAQEFARANAGLPITVADMARAGGISVRALQTNFRQFLHTTPMAYLRQMRLEGVHRDLKAANPSTTVAEVARRWGFVHLGRFSLEYRAMFGTSPSADLAKKNR